MLGVVKQAVVEIGVARGEKSLLEKSFVDSIPWLSKAVFTCGSGADQLIPPWFIRLPQNLPVHSTSPFDSNLHDAPCHGF